MKEIFKEDGFWTPMNVFNLSRLNQSNIIVKYLKRLLTDISLGSEDTFEVCLSKHMVRFKCSYLTHCRIIKTISEMFLYKGMGFECCEVRLDSKKIKTKHLSPLSPVAQVIIKVDGVHKNKCEILIDNNL